MPLPCRTQPPVSPISAAQARALDRAASEDFGLPTIVLMENAARAVAEVVWEEMRQGTARRVLIATGPGNNGGDGLAAARLLHNAGVDVVIAANAPPTSADALIQWRIVNRMGLRVVPWREAVEEAATDSGEQLIVVDALFGTGLSRPLGGEAAELIGRLASLRQAGATVVAVDVPSGLDADTGKPLGEAVVRADVTVTLAAPKAGFGAAGAGEYIGRVVVGDLGIPRQLLDAAGRDAAANQG